MAIDIRHSVNAATDLAKRNPAAAAVIGGVGVAGLVALRIKGSKASAEATPAQEAAKYAGFDDYDSGTSDSPYAAPVTTPAPAPTPAQPKKAYFGDAATVPAGFACPGGSKAIYDKKPGTYAQTTGAVVCRFADGRTVAPKPVQTKK